MVTVTIYGLSLADASIAAPIQGATLSAVRKFTHLGFLEKDVEVFMPADLIPLSKRGVVSVRVYTTDDINCEEKELDKLGKAVSDELSPHFHSGRIAVVVQALNGMCGQYESPDLSAHKTTLFYEHAQEFSRVEGALQTGVDFVFMRSVVSGVSGYHVFVNPKCDRFVAALKAHPRFRLASPPAYDMVYCNGGKPVIFHADYDLEVALVVDIKDIPGFDYRVR